MCGSNPRAVINTVRGAMCEGMKERREERVIDEE
jgi:hypothetical protein